MPRSGSRVRTPSVALLLRAMRKHCSFVLSGTLQLVTVTVKEPENPVPWCATRQVDKLNNENFFFPGTVYVPVSYTHLSLKAILLTHGHFDHIMGIDGVREKFKVPVYASEKEQEILQDARLNLSAAYGGGYTFSDATYVRDGEELEIAGMKIKVIETPGHTAGGCCYYIAEDVYKRQV